jgi:hypothetical protein
VPTNQGAKKNMRDPVIIPARRSVSVTDAEWKKLPDEKKLEYLRQSDRLLEQAIHSLSAQMQTLENRLSKAESVPGDTPQGPRV